MYVQAQLYLEHHEHALDGLSVKYECRSTCSSLRDVLIGNAK